MNRISELTENKISLTNNRTAAILRLSFYDFKAKYAGSVFSLLWAIAEPLVTVLIYWFVYSAALNFQWDGDIPYYLWLSVGLSAWLFISDGIRGMTSAFYDYSYLIKKTGFRKSSVLWIRAFSYAISHIIFLLIVIILCIKNGVFSKMWIFLPFWTLAAFFFVFAIGRIFALLCAKFKDMQSVVGIVFNILFWLTPVFWKIPESASMAITLIADSPLSVLVGGYRSVMLYESFELPPLLFVFCFDAIIFLIGSFMQKKMISTIADTL